jgi:hypothetical protein
MLEKRTRPSVILIDEIDSPKLSWQHLGFGFAGSVERRPD